MVQNCRVEKSQCNLLSNCIWRHLYGEKKIKRLVVQQPQSGCTIHPLLPGYEQENRSVCNSYPSRSSPHLPHPWSNSAKSHLIAIEFHQHNSDKMIQEGTRGCARRGTVMCQNAYIISEQKLVHIPPSLWIRTRSTWLVRDLCGAPETPSCST